MVSNQALSEFDIEEDLLTGLWPVPKKIENIGIYNEICTDYGFNKIIGDPSNWNDILSRKDLYEQWVLPNAILIFGKSWFDKRKWKSGSVCKGTPFALFDSDEKKYATSNEMSIEQTMFGKSVIIKIISKVSHALHTYLLGKWFKGSVKNPGGYLVNAIKYDISRDIGKDLGYKLGLNSICPYCLYADNKKISLIVHGKNNYSCPRCLESNNRLKTEIDTLQKKNSDVDKLFKLYKKTEVFKEFSGVTCVCPSDNCNGKFIPIDYINKEIDQICKEIKVSKNIHKFYKPPESILDFSIICPFCNVVFTLRNALDLKSGYKEKSGYLTGLPSMSIWKQAKNFTITDKNSMQSSFSDSDDSIVSKERVNILVNELIIHMSKLKPNKVSDLVTKCFYIATINWMVNYCKDAANYFFGCVSSEREMTNSELNLYPGETKKKVTSVVRGKEGTIHRIIFQMWISALENNMNEFLNLKSDIRSLEDFRWLCNKPKFSGGPRTSFYSEVNDKYKIVNNSNIVAINSKKIPRLVKIISIYRVENGKINNTINYVKDVKECEWQTVSVKQESLKPGDKVFVEALIMSGHKTHGPIQRIIRLRTKVLFNIVNKIIQEEKGKSRDIEFWKNWKKEVRIAQQIVGIKEQ